MELPTASPTPEYVYSLLRHLTLPVVAITTSAAGRRNGMIANSAQRASLVPTMPRISVYISRTNFSHDLVHRSGIFGVHLLRSDQWDLIRGLGLRSGREGDKLAGLELRVGETGCPMLVDCIAAFECQVVNAMDTGASTFFLGDVVAVREERAGPLLTSDVMRQEAPDDVKAAYVAKLAAAQQAQEPLARLIDPTRVWKGPVAGA